MTNDNQYGDGEAESEEEAAAAIRRLKRFEALALGGIILGIGMAYVTGDDPRLGIAVVALGVVAYAVTRYRIWKQRQ